MFNIRLKRLYKYMAQNGIDAVAVNAGPTLTYLSGLHFHLMERPVVFVFDTKNEPTVILPELERPKLEKLSFPVRIFTFAEDPDQWAAIFKQAMSELNLSEKKIGFEARQLRLLEYNLLNKAIGGGDFVDGSTVFSALRSIKDAKEISNMRRAVKIAEDALEATLPIAKIGVSEKEISSELFLQMLRHGSETTLPFAPIIASGPNGANPHAMPSERPLTEGDLLIIDWGASYMGYASDLTRTFAVGKIDKEAERIHNLVQQANSAGRAAGKPGTACAFVDQVTRKCIEDGGYGEFFTHRTGHGLGLECHEDPYIRSDNEQLLADGMTYTVEPGIYLPGRNGVRIEDDILVTAKGSESLSTMSREIRVIG